MVGRYRACAIAPSRSPGAGGRGRGPTAGAATEREGGGAGGQTLWGRGRDPTPLHHCCYDIVQQQEVATTKMCLIRP